MKKNVDIKELNNLEKHEMWGRLFLERLRNDCNTNQDIVTLKLGDEKRRPKKYPKE